ncbi:MAG TPA: orotidine-5'-phosphate decarboxylase [Vicinamibacterales bacterium]|nr:orotidine-5'-phosphate decarboxylase [Vicinamibacterales bacterium]
MDQLLVALDVDSGARALQLAEKLTGLVGGVKIGSRLFTLEGPGLVKRITDTGLRVFLDLKFHDIPNTVAQAVEAATLTGAWMINVHASGGVPMMQAAAKAAADTARMARRPKPLLIGVTVLTSMDEPTLHDVGVSRPLMQHVVELARMAQRAGLDGVVASPLETREIRDTCGHDFAVVTPGIRGAAAGAEKNDQSRTMGPGEAIKAGSTYLVVGRPIIAAPDPRAAAEAIGAEVRQALAS